MNEVKTNLTTYLVVKQTADIDEELTIDIFSLPYTFNWIDYLLYSHKD